MIADPVCPRCKVRQVWIGIGPGAEPVCPANCAETLPHSQCPHCLSFEIEAFEAFDGSVYNSWFGLPTGVPDTCHCIKCGKVFAKKDALP